jgi:sugar/nucleoside kinase (ribokinase family)
VSPGLKGVEDALSEEGTKVLRPNHEELMKIYSLTPLSTASPELCPTIERLANHLINLGVGADGNGVVVVRCGRLGACVATRRRGTKWVPAYFEGSEEERVVDVTGGRCLFDSSCGREGLDLVATYLCYLVVVGM